MPADVVRNLGPSKNQSFSYDAIGHAEDIAKIIYNIDPSTTQLLSAMDEGEEATATDITWMTQGLEPPSVNAHLEVEDYNTKEVGSMEGMTNTVQYFQSVGRVSDVEKKVKHNPNFDPWNQAVTNAFTKMAFDIEYALINNDKRVVGTATVAPMFGGLPFFLDLNTQDATFDHTTENFTTATPHHLRTGDFVYLLADDMPTGLVAQRLYYVRQDATNPDTVFTIYDTQKDAVENITANKVGGTTDGTNVKICKANVTSLAKQRDFNLDDLNNVMQMAANRGGTPTDAYMAPEKKRHFSLLVTGQATTTRTAADRSYGDVATSYTTDGGVVTAHAHRMYPPSRVDILDMNYWETRWMEHPHQVQGLEKKGTYDRFVLEAKLTLQASQPKASASIIDIKR